MTARDKAILKGYFEDRDVPTGSQFADLIDSTAVVSETGDIIADGNVTSKRLGVGVASPTVRVDVLDTLSGTYATSAALKSYIFDTNYTSASNLTDSVSSIVSAQFVGTITSNANINKFYGVFMNPQHAGTGHINNLFGAVYEPTNNSSGTISNLLGFIAQPIQNGTGLVDALYGFQASPAITNTGNVTLLNGLIATYSASAATTIGYSTIATIGRPSLTGGATVTNTHIGLYIQDQSGIGGVASYALQSVGGTVSFSGGNVGVATGTPQNVFEVLPGSNGMISVGNGYCAAAGNIVGIHIGYLSSSNLNYRKTAIVYEGTGDGNVRGNFHVLMNNDVGSGSATLADSRLMINSPGSVMIGTTTDGMTAGGSLAIAKDLAHRGTKVGFYNTTPIVQQTGVAVTAAGIHAALVNLGLITA
jgi:hypothetical protein